MEATLLVVNDFNLNSDTLCSELRIEPKSKHGLRLAELCQEAVTVARPCALFRSADIEAKEDDRIIVEGIAFNSCVLRTNLEEAYRIYPFIATSGVELETWSNSFNTLLDNYWSDMIKEKALYAAVDRLKEHLSVHYRLNKIAMMNPGSLEDWKIEEQKELFRLISNDLQKVGVTLSENNLMYPIKSVSGFIFPTEVGFENCKLCNRQNCPGRRSPFDPVLYEKYYHRKP